MGRVTRMLLGLALLLPAPAGAQGSLETARTDPWTAAGFTTAQRDALRRRLREGVSRGDVAGGALLIERKGVVIFGEGFGWADIARKEPFTPTHGGFIASMTKMLSATLLARLAEQQRLSLDDPASKHVPGAARLRVRGGGPAPSPTIRQLLSHTAGFPGNDDRDAVRRGDGLTRPLALPVVIENLLAYGLLSPPGTTYRYSGLGFDLAARCAEVATGTEFGELMARELLTPLGMKDTTFRPDALTIATAPVRYTRTKKSGALVPETRQRPVVPPGVYVGAGGGLYSTLEDLRRFLRMQLDQGQVGATPWMAADRLLPLFQQQPATRGYGLGFNLVGARPGRRPDVALHGGASGTLGWIDFRHQVVGVILTQTSARHQRGFNRRMMAEVERLYAGPRPITERVRRIFARLDKDGSGAISKDEAPPRVAARFADVDRDGSGGISLAELAAVMPPR